MKVKRKQIKEALQNKFLGLEKLTMTLPEVIKYSNEAVDELYWQYKQEKAAEDSGKEEQKVYEVLANIELSNMAYKIKQAIGTDTFMNELLNRISTHELKAILLDIVNDFELNLKGGNKNE